MSQAESGRVHILRQLAVPDGVAAEGTGNHFLLSLTRRSERCRSGSEVSGAGLYERQGAERRSRGVEGGGILDELMASTWLHPSTAAFWWPCFNTIVRNFLANHSV
jgi:hypothetical protein